MCIKAPNKFAIGPKFKITKSTLSRLRVSKMLNESLVLILPLNPSSGGMEPIEKTHHLNRCKGISVDQANYILKEEYAYIH